MAAPQALSPPAPPAGPNRAERRRWIKMREVADYLNCTDRTVRQMVADGRLTAYMNGNRRVRVDLNEVDAAMAPYGGGLA